MTATFRRSDGVEFICDESSASFEMMQKDGSFTRIDAAETAPDMTAVKAPKDRSKMKKAELVAEAEGLGLDVVPDKMTVKQIIAAIEEKEAAE
jgi:hypothetical protein